MDAAAFDRLTRTVFHTASRRATLGALLGSTVAAFGLAGTDRAIAQTDCSLKANGQRCSDGSECCSGRCHRRRRSGPKVCRQAGNQGECTVEENVCTSGSSISCGTTSGGGACACYVTTRGRSFCGGGAVPPCGCTSNKECEQQAGEGAKCVPTESSCSHCGPGGGNVCVIPCPNLDPVP